MRRAPIRFALEVAFLIAAAVVVAVVELGTAWIIVVMAAAFAIVAAFEIAYTASLAAPVEQPAPAPEQRAEPEPHVRVLPREEPKEPPPPEPPALEVVAEPAPEPEPEPAPEPAPPPVVSLPVRGTGREWNVWDLERLAREHAGEDAARDEERSYLLVYLRDFANPSGTLSADFDGVVRDAFGDLLESAAPS